MKKRLHNKKITSINVVPYIDVMLVLLVIFMVTAPLLNPGIVDLPSVGKSSTQPTAPIEITIKKDGSYLYTNRVNSKAMRKDKLENIIRPTKLLFLKAFKKFFSPPLFTRYC